MAAKTISVRLDPADVSRLAAEAGKVGVSPGTLARVLIRAGLDAPPEPARWARAAKIRALDRRMHAHWPVGHQPIDSVALVREGRDELDGRLPIPAGPHPPPRR